MCLTAQDSCCPKLGGAVHFDISKILQRSLHLEHQALGSDLEIGEKETIAVMVWRVIDVVSLPSDLQVSRQNAQTVCDALMLTDS